MTLIYELNQRVIHISEVFLALPCSGGDFSGIRVKIQIFELLWMILGGKFSDPSNFLSNDNRLQRSKLSRCRAIVCQRDLPQHTICGFTNAIEIRMFLG